jgi:inosine-uridine nucleoside N-ribohydrolase
MLDSWSGEGVYAWDLVAAVNATEPDLCAEVPLSVDIVVTPGPDQGQTVIGGQPQNSNACLDPDPDQIRALAAAVLGR